MVATLMCPVNSQNDEKLAYYAFSLANACVVARNTRRNFCCGARASIHLVLDCPKYYSSAIIIVRLPEEEKSKEQGHLLI